MTCCSIVELRDYTLHPGRRDELIELFDREFVESQEELGIHVIGQFRDLDRADHFVWMRGFSDMEARRHALTAFYEGEVWTQLRDAANATMIDSDDVLLLHPCSAGSGFVHPAPVPRDAAGYGSAFEIDVIPKADGRWQKDPSALAEFETEHSENSYPRLPIREDADVLVSVRKVVSPDALRPVQPGVMRLTPTERSELR